MKYKKVIINIIIFFIVIVLELSIATVIRYEKYHDEYNFSEYAFLESPDNNFAIQIKYDSGFWVPFGKAINIYCVDLRQKPYNTVRYIGTWDGYFNTSIPPEEYYKMEWAKKGVTMVVNPGEGNSPKKYEIEWDRVFDYE